MGAVCIPRQDSISSFSKWGMVVVGCLTAMVVLGFGRISYGVVMPFLQKSLGIDYVQAGWLGTANSLGYILLVAFAGPLASRFGNKALVTSGLALVSLCLTLLSQANSFPAASLLMILMGIGTALAFTPMVALLINWLPGYRGLVTGLVNGAIGFGAMVAGITVPLLVGLLPASGWRVSWFSFGIAGVLVMLGAIAVLRNPAVKRDAGPEKNDSSWKLVYFQRHVLLIGLAYFFVGFAYIIPQTFGMAFMIESGIGKHTAGTILALGGLLSLFSGSVWGAISDRWGRRSILAANLGLSLFSALIPAIHPGTAAFIAASAIGGISISGVFGLIMARASELVEPRLLPETLSYVTLFFGAGQLASPALAGLIIQQLGDFRPAYMLCGLLFLLASFFSYSVPEKAKMRLAA